MINAPVAKLVDATVFKTDAGKRAGSSPARCNPYYRPTNGSKQLLLRFTSLPGQSMRKAPAPGIVADYRGLTLRAVVWYVRKQAHAYRNLT